jgi:hypothetical protein
MKELNSIKTECYLDFTLPLPGLSGMQPAAGNSAFWLIFNKLSPQLLSTISR